MHQKGRFYYNVVHLISTDMFWYHLHKENSKNQKVENDQNSKWPHFDVLAPKWPISILLTMSSAKQYSFVSFDT